MQVWHERERLAKQKNACAEARELRHRGQVGNGGSIFSSPKQRLRRGQKNCDITSQRWQPETMPAQRQKNCDLDGARSTWLQTAETMPAQRLENCDYVRSASRTEIETLPVQRQKNCNAAT